MNIFDVSNAPNHRVAIANLITHYEWNIGAEIGVGAGHLSRLLLSRFPNLTLIGVDILNKPHWEKRIRGIEEKYSPRYILLGMTSVKAADHVEDKSLDFIFIDAGHSYASVDADIKKWKNKVREGGIVLGHDYGHPKFPGVAQAARKHFDFRIELLGHGIWAVQF